MCSIIFYSTNARVLTLVSAFARLLELTIRTEVVCRFCSRL